MPGQVPKALVLRGAHQRQLHVPSSPARGRDGGRSGAAPGARATPTARKAPGPALRGTATVQQRVQTDGDRRVPGRRRQGTDRARARQPGAGCLAPRAPGRHEAGLGYACAGGRGEPVAVEAVMHRRACRPEGLGDRPGQRREHVGEGLVGQEDASTNSSKWCWLPHGRWRSTIPSMPGTSRRGMAPISTQAVVPSGWSTRRPSGHRHRRGRPPRSRPGLRAPGRSGPAGGSRPCCDRPARRGASRASTRSSRRHSGRRRRGRARRTDSRSCRRSCGRPRRGSPRRREGRRVRHRRTCRAKHCARRCQTPPPASRRGAARWP